MPTTNRPSRHYGASNCYQIGGYDSDRESMATKTLSNVPRPDIESPFPRQCPGEFLHWPSHALQTDFPMSLNIPNFDVSSRFSSAAVPFDALEAMMCDLRASSEANLPIASSILDSDPRAPYPSGFSTDVPSRRAHFEASQAILPMTSSVSDSDLRAPYLGDFPTDIPLRCSDFEASQSVLPMMSSVLDSDLRAPYLGNFSTDIPSRHSHFEALQTTLPMTSNVLASDLRAPYLCNFPADLPARPSQLDASLPSFPITSSIPNLDLSTSLDSPPAIITAASSFQINFPDPWIISDPFSPITSNILNPDFRAPYFGNCPLDLPARPSQFEHSPTSFSTTLNI